MTNTDELKRLAEGEMPLIAARKRIYWIVRNKIELLRDTGQTKDADFDNEAWEVISRQLDENATLRAELDKALEVIGPIEKLARFWLERDEIHGLDDEDTCATELEFGLLRAAAAFTERHKSQATGETGS